MLTTRKKQVFKHFLFKCVTQPDLSGVPLNRQKMVVQWQNWLFCFTTLSHLGTLKYIYNRKGSLCSKNCPYKVKNLKVFLDYPFKYYTFKWLKLCLYLHHFMILVQTLKNINSPPGQRSMTAISAGPLFIIWPAYIREPFMKLFHFFFFLLWARFCYLSGPRSSWFLYRRWP